MTQNPTDNHSESYDEGQAPHQSTEHTDGDVMALQRQVADLTDALQRERADATNIRRQHSQQIAQLKTTLKASIVSDLLPVVDNFERALKHVPEELKDDAYVKGVQGVVKQFDKTLTDLGVERIATTGEAFNPHWHEAVSMEEGDGENEVVSEELQPGYRLGDEVIRPAMVRVTMQ
jgi:molecular chaperone GrpE